MQVVVAALHDVERVDPGAHLGDGPGERRGRAGVGAARQQAQEEALGQPRRRFAEDLERAGDACGGGAGAPRHVDAQPDGGGRAVVGVQGGVGEGGGDEEGGRRLICAQPKRHQRLGDLLVEGFCL